MKIKIVIAVATCFLIVFSSPSVFGMDAREIMIKADRVARESSFSSVQKVKLITCKYGKKGNKDVCQGTPRIKTLESVQKDVGENGKDSKSVSFILEPVSEKGMGMLSYEYDDPDKDNVNWIYLSAMNKVKKIVSGNGDDEESGSFFGSEFLLEDLENVEVDDYSYSLVEETRLRKRPVWVIEASPTSKRQRKTRYGKTKIWVDKERLIPLMCQMFDKNLRPYKQMMAGNVENIDGVWVARVIQIKNLISKRMSAMTLESTRFNVDIPEEFLSERALIDFAFRERELARLRKHLL